MDYGRTEERFDKNAERLIRNFGYAHGPEGQAIINRYVDRLVEFAKVRMERPPLRNRPQKALTPELWEAMRGVSDRILAQAVLTGAINAIWTRDPNDESAALKARIAIGREIWRQVRGAAIPEELVDKISKRAFRKSSIRAREGVAREALKEAGINISRWRDDFLSLAGNWGFDCLLRELREVFYEAKDGTPDIFEEVADWGEAFVHGVMHNHPIFSPLDKPPAPWTDFEDIHSTPFVRKAREETAIRLAMASGQMQPHVDAVNRLQAVAWTINEPVLKFVKALGDRRAERVLCDRLELAQLKKVKTELRRKIKAEQLKRKLLTKVKRKGGWTTFAIDMGIATGLVGNSFWLQHNIDFRGRIYPLSHFSYIRPDHIRGLFKFAKGEPIGEDGIRWLKIAAASAFNADKRMARRTFAERLAWAEDNLDAICDAAADPMSRLVWLATASDPIQFLAIAIELRNALTEGLGYETTVPIGYDASCSGAQHYSLLARHPRGAELTNLLPNKDEDGNDIVNCLYDTGRQRGAMRIAKDHAEFDWGADGGVWSANGYHAKWLNDRVRVDRVLFKMLGVTYFYGSQEGGQRLAVYDELFERDFAPEDIPKDAVTYLIRVAREAIERELKGGAPDYMEWLRAVAKALGEKGIAIEWRSPTGLPITNLYRRALNKTPQLWLGDKQKRYKTAIGYGEFNKRKATNAIAPNLIHSLDAALVVGATNTCASEGIPLTTVHDTFATLASRATRLREILQDELVGLYKRRETNELLTEIREDAVRAAPSLDNELPPVPAQGDLDLEQVRLARYTLN